jgi:3-dehydroquinate synthase
MKAAIVARDEREIGDRALLNLGHTFGHALEAAGGYTGAIVHGEAISVGMVLAHDFSVRMNLMGPDDSIRVRRHLEAVGLPVRMDQLPVAIPDASGLLDLILQDKKVVRGTLTFILTRGIGRAFIAREVPAEAVRAFLADQRGR